MMKTICISRQRSKRTTRWDVILRKAHSTERANKPETMRQAENKRHDPGRARIDSRSPFAPAGEEFREGIVQ
jgi:hypothetical protein